MTPDVPPTVPADDVDAALLVIGSLKKQPPFLRNGWMTAKCRHRMLVLFHYCPLLCCSAALSLPLFPLPLK
jgi:hypothetical protein